jgi:DNA-binding transcriptional MerR regulator
MAERAESGARRPGKSAVAFRTISEVAEELDVPQHVLRFWESKFAQVKPLKRGGGRRYYRPEDVLLLRRIRQCLYQDGYTIKGVQRLLREGSLKGSAPPAEAAEPAPVQLEGAAPETPPADEDLMGVLKEIRNELGELRRLLRRR